MLGGDRLTGSILTNQNFNSIQNKIVYMQQELLQKIERIEEKVENIERKVDFILENILPMENPEEDEIEAYYEALDEKEQDKLISLKDLENELESSSNR